MLDCHIKAREMRESNTIIEGSNSLADLAARIKIEHEAASVALKDGVRHAIVAGELLIEAKARLEHGQWLPWLRDHCAITERKAQRYMRMAKNKSTIKSDTLSDLSFTGALALLSVPRETLKENAVELTLETLCSSEIADEALAHMAARAMRKPLLDKALADFNRIGELMKAALQQQTDNQLFETLDALSEKLCPAVITTSEALKAAVLGDYHETAHNLTEKLCGLVTEYLQQVEAAL